MKGPFVSKRQRTIATLIVILGALWTLLPLYWMFITAFKSWHELQVLRPTLFPRVWSLTGVKAAWEHAGVSLLDSAIVALGTLLVSLGLGIPAAYGLSQFGTEGREVAFSVLVFRFMPPVALSVAFYQIAVQVGVIDTHLLLILANSMFSIPFVIWMMKKFMDRIPYSIVEAAQTDGADRLTAIRDHLVPLAMPGLIAVGLFVVVFTWNEFILAMILTGDDVLPFTRAVRGLWLGKKYLKQPNWPAISALGVLNVGVVFLLGFYLQRYIVPAMTYGAVWDEAVWE